MKKKSIIVQNGVNPATTLELGIYLTPVPGPVSVAIGPPTPVSTPVPTSCPISHSFGTLFRWNMHSMGRISYDILIILGVIGKGNYHHHE